MSIASSSVEERIHDDFKLYQPSMLNNGGGDVIGACANRPRQTTETNISNIFLHHAQQKLGTAQGQTEQSMCWRNWIIMSVTNTRAVESTAQNQFPDFMTANQDDAAKMIDDLFSFDAFAHGPMIRRGSAPQSSAFCTESMKGNIPRAQTFPRHNQALPSPSQNTHMQCLSTFDLAPLPHSNFVNLATLSMPLEGDVESYFTPQSSLGSPTFPPAQASAELRHAGLFENTMSTVPEENFSSERPMVKAPQLPENTTFDISEMPKQRERGETTPQPLGAKATGISMEEIASFIAGPESDGKWICKYPDCGKRFGRKENIKSHVQTHLGDRQFQCIVCKKCFVRQHDLKRHSKIHTGIKPYPCLCGNSFARHDALTRHRQRGMCIGAFEGIVKKVAKRGRPRKRPLNENGSESAKNNQSLDKSLDQESSSSSSGSDVSEPRSPTAHESASPPETPNSDQYDSSASSAGRSVKEESPEFLPYSLDSPDYTPPTSPPEFYEFEDFTPKADSSKRSSYSSTSMPDDDFKPHNIDYSEFGLPNSRSDNGKCGSEYSSDDFSQASGHDDEFMFSQDQLEMFGLSTLERDPGILGLGSGEDIYIKPELLSNP
jgi:regulatory protein SWI5